ncbi:MAG: hypothetical protein GC164_12890 [Phycisphaera sp.]|nr:hypothetical protein [Phycisphaera sp.]
MSTPPRKTQPPQTPRRRSWRKIALRVALVVAVALGVAVALMRTAPQAYTQRLKTLDTLTAQERVAMALRLDERLRRELDEAEVNTPQDSLKTGDRKHVGATVGQNGLPDQPRIVTLSMSYDEVNAWLSVNYRRWMSDQGFQLPREVTKPILTVDDGKMLLGFSVQTDYVSQVFTTKFDLGYSSDGKCSLRLSEVRAGSLPIPTRAIGSSLQTAAPTDSKADRVGQWLEKMDRVEFTPMVRVDDQRKIRVLSHRITKDGLEMLIRVERRGSSLPPPPPSIVEAAIRDWN